MTMQRQRAPCRGGAPRHFRRRTSDDGTVATDVDAAALLTYRAAWLRDVRNARTTKEAVGRTVVAEAKEAQA